MQTDEQLLKSFVEGRSEDAFADLVLRHGPMVLGVCRRVVRQTEDAEDAFQATFLVLSRRAGVVAPSGLANWLYGVAYRTALKTRTIAARRRCKEQTMQALPEAPGWSRTVDRELIEMLDAALSQLPARYRSAVVLCDLEQRTRREAAASLQIPEGTLSSRLAAGRKMLADRLRPRGVTISVGALGIALAMISRSALAEILVVSTAQAAIRFSAVGPAASAVASSQAATLAQGVLEMMIIKKMAVVLALLVGGASFVGLGALVYGARHVGPDDTFPRQDEQRTNVTVAANGAGNVAAKLDEVTSSNTNQSGKQESKSTDEPITDQPKPDARQAVQKALEGEWIVESVEDHADARDAKGYQVIFERDRFMFKPPMRNAQPFAGRYEIDPDKGPQIIEFIAEKDGKPRRAIYDLKRDELRICINEEADGERPDRFVSEKRGKNDLLMVLKRKPAKATK
jgi:RNA polymerase sigma factor (sigma-70 family)